MRVILKRGVDAKQGRFEASPDPQDVPDSLAKLLIARGPHVCVAASSPKKKPAAKKGDKATVAEQVTIEKSG